MAVETFLYDLAAKKWSRPTLPAMDSERTLVLLFGAPGFLDQPQAIKDLRKAYPKAHMLGCSSAGEIAGTTVRDNALSVAVARFEKTTMSTAVVEVAEAGQSLAAGRELARKLDRPGLRGVLVLSEGLKVNGSQLVKGLNSVLSESVVVTGGLSGDGTAFKRTWVCLGDRIQSGMVAAVGFYGDHIVISHGSKGGWDKFGPERVVTRSEANVLYELDSKPALSLYKEYLGEKAADLPASGLLFPLAMRATSKDEKFLVRTLLAVDHEKKSMTFAGDVPKGYLVQLMKADFERLIDGASRAAEAARSMTVAAANGGVLAVAISCVGRRLVLGDRTEEEVEAVMDVLPMGAQVTGFYSYGEISPYATGHCDLHNQTMTLTVLSESPTPIDRRAASMRPPVAAKVEAKAPVSAPSPVSTPAPMSTRSPRQKLPSLDGEIEGVREAVTSDPGRQSSPLSTRSQDLSAPISTSVPRSAVMQLQKGSSAQAARQKERPPTRSIALPAATASAGITADLSKISAVQVIKLAGRMTEAFKGADLGKRLTGIALFDLSGVERITSFGVREWLQLLREAGSRVSQIYLARCSEPVVNQVSMIRGFSGSGRVLSFYAPYCCESCAHQFERLIDCELDSAAIKAGKAPAAACPRCAAAANFDDDPQSYLAFAVPHADAAISTEIRGILDEIERASDPSGAEAVEKTVDGRITRLKVNCKLDASVRWNRILDGLEGQVVFDLGAAPGVTPEGAASFEGALGRLHDVEVIRVEGCPPKLAPLLSGSGVASRVVIGSVIVDARCGPCGAVRTVMVSVKDNADAQRAGLDPVIPCKRCNTPLSFDDARPILSLLGTREKAPRPASAEPKLSPAAPPAKVAAPPAKVTAPPPSEREPAPVAAPRIAPPASAPKRSGPALLLAVLAVIAAFAVALAVVKPRWAALSAAPLPSGAAVAPSASAAGSAAALSTAWATSAELLPAWTERPFVIEGESVFVVGRGGPAGDEEAALAMARSDAVERIASNMVPELMGSPIYDFLALRAAPDANRADRQKEVIELVARRYMKQVGTIAAPERVGAVMRKKSAGVEAVARYKLSKQSFAEALAVYKKTSSFIGVTVGRFFPALESTIHTDGEIIVVATEKNWQVDKEGLRPGDMIIDVNGRAVTSIDAFDKAMSDALASAPPGSPIPMQIESLGARRSVHFMVPRQ